MRHEACGADFAPLLVCRSCGERARATKTLWRNGARADRGRGPSRSRRRGGDRRPSAMRRPGLFPQTMSVHGQPVGFRTAGRGVRRHQPVHRLPDASSALRPARSPTGCRSSPPTACLSSADNRYRLTEKGRALFPVLVTALQWAQRWFQAPEGPAVILTHTACGRRFTRGPDVRPVRPAAARDAGPPRSSHATRAARKMARKSICSAVSY